MAVTHEWVVPVTDLRTVLVKCPKCKNTISYDVLTPDSIQLPGRCGFCSGELSWLPDLLQSFRSLYRGAEATKAEFRFRGSGGLTTGSHDNARTVPPDVALTPRQRLGGMGRRERARRLRCVGVSGWRLNRQQRLRRGHRDARQGCRVLALKQQTEHRCDAECGEWELIEVEA